MSRRMTMSAPLWRGPLRRVVGGVAVPGPLDEEVEVWRAGDRIGSVADYYAGWADARAGRQYGEGRRRGDRPVPPTRDQVRRVITRWYVDDGQLDMTSSDDLLVSEVEELTDNLMALLSGGVPTEPEEST